MQQAIDILDEMILEANNAKSIGESFTHGIAIGTLKEVKSRIQALDDNPTYTIQDNLSFDGNKFS